MLKASGLGLFSSTRLDGSKDIQSVKSAWSIFIQEFKAHIPPQSSWGEYKQRKTNTQCSQQLNKNSIANKLEMEKNIRAFGSILPQPYPQPQTLLCRGIEKLVILNRLLTRRWTLVITRCFRKNHCHNSGKLIWIFKKHHNLSWSNHFFNTRWKNTNRNFWKLSTNFSHTKHIILLQMVLLNGVFE